MNTNVDVELFSVLSVRDLTESTYILRFARKRMAFKPGQHLVVGIPGSGEYREYSIYSGINEDFLEILIKEVDDGMVSKDLKGLKAGDMVEVRGPYGFFMTNDIPDEGSHVYLIASGTGVAPFHSLIQSNPSLNYTLIHGVRDSDEAYERDHYLDGQYIVCTSRDEEGDFTGRLTDYLLEKDFHTDSSVFLCGNSNMIFDAMDILHAKGIPQRQIFTEVYF